MSLTQNKHLLFDSLRHLLIQSKVQKEIFSHCLQRHSRNAGKKREVLSVEGII